MRRGPKTKPTNIKILEGNPGKRPLPAIPLDPGPERAEAPAHLDSYAQECWHRYSPGLERMKVLTRVDEIAFASYCVHFSRWRRSEEELNRLAERNPIAGLVMKTTNGNVVQQTLVGISNSAMKRMLVFANEFGMTAAARANLDIHAVPTKQSKFAGLIGIDGGKKQKA